MLVATVIAISASLATPVAGATTAHQDVQRGATGSDRDAAVRQLLRHIPFDHRFRCNDRDPADASFYDSATLAEAASTSAAVTCGPTDEVDFLGYWQFTDRAAMERAHGALVLTGGNTEDSDDCPVDSTWGFGDGTDGKLTCFYGTQRGDVTIPPTVSRVWTDHRNLILGQVSLPEGNDDAFELREWWREHAGPLQEPDDDVFSEGVDARASRRLLRSIPKRTRAACEVADPFAEEGNRSDRFYIEAFVTCPQPGGAVGVVTYAKVDPGIVEDLLEDAWTAPRAQLDAADHDAVCPATGPWTEQVGSKEREVGSYSCFYAGSAQGDYALWAWTDTDAGILAVAAGVNDDAEALRKWWRSSASGPLQ